MDALKGYRTYIVAGLLGLLAAARYLGYITPETAATIEAALIGGGLAALRAAK